MDETGLPDSDKLRIIGLLSSYTLSEARMADDAKRAALAAAGTEAAETEGAGTERAGTELAGTEPAEPAGDTGAEPPPDYGWLLRELVDERTYPRLYRLAWDPAPDGQLTEREEFLFGIDLILDGAQALIDRADGGY
jgi:hypothetical protein